MAVTDVELSKDAPRLIEGYPRAADQATKEDIASVLTQIAGLRAEIHRSAASTMRWMLAFFAPVWAITWGTVVAVVLKG